MKRAIETWYLRRRIHYIQRDQGWTDGAFWFILIRVERSPELTYTQVMFKMHPWISQKYPCHMHVLIHSTLKCFASRIMFQTQKYQLFYKSISFVYRPFIKNMVAQWKMISYRFKLARLNSFEKENSFELPTQ